MSRLSLNPDDPNGHVLYGRFGEEQINQSGMMDKLLRESPMVRPTVASMLSRMAYHTDYGIFDHYGGNEKRPLALIALHPKENTFEGGPILSLLRRYHNDRVYELGWTYKDLLALPFPEAMVVFDIARHLCIAKDSTIGGVVNQMNKELNKL